MKLIKYLSIFVLLIIAVVVGLVFTIDADQIKNQVVQTVSDSTGREFRVDGDISIIPSLSPTVALEKVSLANATWGSKPNMVNVEKFKVQMDLMPLLQGNVSINRIELQAPEIILETDKKGNPNWVFSSAKSKETSNDGSSTSSLGIGFNNVAIKDALILYIDGQSGKQTELTLENVLLQSNGMDSPLAIELVAALNKAPINLTISLGSVNQLLADQKTPIKVSGNIDKATLTVDGTINKPLSARGLNLPFEFSVDTLDSLNRIAGTELPNEGPIAIKGTLSDSGGGYSIQSMDATVLTYTVSGDVSVKTAGARPYLKANLATETLDLSSFSEGSEDDSKASDKVFSDKPLELSSLKSADADITFRAKKLLTSSMEFTDMSVVLGLQNGKLRINPLVGNLAGGDLNTQLVLDASNAKSANMDLKITMNNVELGQLPQIKEQNLLQGGKTDAKIALAGKGQSVAALVGSLNGNIEIVTGEGKLSNTSVDLAGADIIYSTLDMINPFSKKEDYTQMQCGVISFSIKNGVAQSDEGIAIQTQRMNVLGSGIIHLKTEELDMGIRPQARDGMGAGLGKLVSLVRIGGTLAKPSPKVDTKGLLRAGATVGAAVATGGLSFLAEGLLDKAAANDNPCDVALGKTAKTTTAPASTEKSAPDKAVENVKEKAKDKAKDLLKKLF